ncbi:MAG: phosphoribosylglycinamide formyltransferase [Phycisphaeraceae bacterium]|nr:phosphoribosylglycinamide formyltransferase [Phycisphaeraceae bacterium]MCW5763938.1 phosphoribosylglycinamide formyltransferase [Phycisphaeraceae bacterium]
MKSQSRARLLVLLSGSGRTLLNLADAIDRGELDAEIALVVASRECLGEQRARERGLATRVIAGRLNAEHLLSLVEASRADVVVLAGYLHLVPVPEALRGRIVNIHPALLPEFGGPGMHGLKVHEAVLRAGRTTSGCTVHLCDERYDTGPILLQRTCPVLPDDTPETLAARVFEQECIAYPQALNDLIAQRVSSGEP